MPQGLGDDGLYDTADDIITHFRSGDFGSSDPEGIAFDDWRGHLFVVDGTNEEVYDVDPGENGIFDGLPANDYHTVKPQWTDISRTTVYCGACHYGWDKPSDITNAYDKPNTGAHRKVAQHSGASQFGWHADDDAVPCMECHWRYDTYGTSNENQWWRPYGSDAHVDGGVWIWPPGTADGAGLFGPLSESQGYTGGCHNTWPGGWQKGYPGAC